MIINLCGNSGGGAPPVLDSLYVEQNGVYIPSEGVDGYSEVTVNVDSGGSTPINLQELIVNENGEYLPDEGYDGFNLVTVNVPTGTTNYSYKTPTADVNGLKAIGWNDESIGYFRDNNLCYDWQQDDYIVTEGNKELYGVITKDNISTYKLDPNFVYCPMLNTSNVTRMYEFFRDCKNLQSIPLLNTSNVTDMNNMFNNCKTLQSIPPIDTTKVTSMSGMFQYCSSLQSIPPIDTTKVITMSNMFNGCETLQSIPTLNTSNVTDMGSMFYNCKSLQSIPLLDTSNVTKMSNMFYNCTSLQSIPLLDCGNVTNVGSFFGFSNITTLTDLGGFKDLKISVTSSFLDKAPNLTVDSLMNVINNVYDLTTNGLSGQSLKFGQTNLDKLTPEQIAVATAKGWTLTA